MNRDNGQPAELDHLRREIERIDHAFVDLLRERQDAARRVIACKMKANVPLRNYSVERQVIDRFARLCAEGGLEPQWGRELAEFLIGRSVELQSSQLDRRRPGDPRSVLVIGGAGKMGSWLVSFFRNQGHAVCSFDPAASDDADAVTDLAAAVRQAEIIIVSVPLAQSPAALAAVLSLQPAGLLFDVCSMKRGIAPQLRAAAAAGMRVTSLHPLFGPDVTTLSGRNIVLCSCGSQEADAEATALFSETAATLVRLDLEEHDRLMSLTLGMSHALNLLFARALAASGAPFAALGAVASSTFSKQLSTTLAVAGENMDLYYEIQRQCDHGLIYQLLGSELRALAGAVEHADRQGFLREMRQVGEYFSLAEERDVEHA